MSRLLTGGAALAVVVLGLSGRAAPGGTIRDDRGDNLYVGLAAQPQFRASGYLGILAGTATRGSGSATLVAPNWVLTAAHCVYDEQGPAGDSWTFEVGEQVIQIPARNVFFPRSWVTSGFDSGHDVAMLHLPIPVRGIRPAGIGAAKDEVGNVLTTVGYGATGTGLTGGLGDGGVRRAGQNVIDATQAEIVVPGFLARGPISVGNARTLLCDFDSPQASTSTLGQKIPLHLEYAPAPGDSGGAAFMQAAGTRARVVGVVSGGLVPNGLTSSSYGTTVVYARISENAEWIRSVMAGNEPPLPMLQNELQPVAVQQAAAIARQRLDAAARKGYRMQRFISWSGGGQAVEESGPPPRATVSDSR